MKEKIGKETVIAIFKDDYGMAEESINTIVDFIEINGTTNEKIEKCIITKESVEGKGKPRVVRDAV
mgnify:CR=1 FL=1